MHIIIDGTTTQDELAYHGVGQYTKNIILSLVKNYRKTEFSILLFNDKKSTLDDILDESGKNYKIERIGEYRSNNFLNDLWYIRQFAPKIKEIKRNDSIFFSPYFWRNFPAYTMPTVLFVHDFNLPRFKMYSQRSKFHNMVRSLQYWLTMNKSVKCKYILCNSYATRTDFLRYFPRYSGERTLVSHLGVNFKEEEVSLKGVLPSDYKKRKYLIYLGGGINRSKNSEGVIKAYAQFLKRFKKKENLPYLVIAGKIFTEQERPEVISMNKLIKRLKLTDKVIFTGFYSDDQKYSLLSNAFAFIHLSLFEGFGIAVAEAMRSKVPVIVHDSEIYREVVGDGGIFVNGLDPKEAGNKIYQLFVNNRLAKSMAEKGYKISLEYDWDKTAEITHNIFDNISAGI